jgi:anthranilate/para-aminobenzoate synthase component II
VQFHPESILTFEGKHLLQNFLDGLDKNGTTR